MVQERVISERMEAAYRHRHHEFGGKTEEETARIMGITPDAVRRLLWKLRKTAPQLFPILTPLQARAYHLWFHEGMSHNTIADIMGVSVNAVKKLIGRAKRKLDYHKVLNQRLLVMDPSQLASFEIGVEIVNVF